MMKSLFVAFALSGAAVASALESGSGLQAHSLPTEDASILETSEMSTVSRRHLASKSITRRERGWERGERDGERRERDGERRERDGERRERFGERGERRKRDDGGYGSDDGVPPEEEDAEKPSTRDVPMPGPRPAPGPEGPPLPGPPLPGADTPLAPGPEQPPSVVIPGNAAAPGPSGPPGRDLARPPTNLQDGPNYAGPNGPLSGIEDFNNSEDGLITEEEVDAYILGNRERVIGVPAFFYESDTNGDLMLTPDELAVVVPIGAFDGTDENPADGIVTEEEVLTWSAAPGRSYRAIGVKAFWREIDTNGDNVVDEDEIQAAHDTGFLAWD